MRIFIDIMERAVSPVERPGFSQWFSGSKVVDPRGNPLACYHGTYEDFSTFSMENGVTVSSGFNALGYWFDVDPETPSYFAGYEAGKDFQTGTVMPVYLSIKKPFILDSEWLFDEDVERIRELRERLLSLRTVRDTAVTDRLGFRLLPDGKPFDEPAYQSVNREYETLYGELMNERVDGFVRLMQSLPRGAKSSTSEVNGFRDQLIAEGYDGIFLGDTAADFAARNYRATDWWIAFHPNQIKSVFAQSYNGENNSIMEDQ